MTCLSKRHSVQTALFLPWGWLHSQATSSREGIIRSEITDNWQDPCPLKSPIIVTNVWSAAGVLCSASCPARLGSGQAASLQVAAVRGFTASLRRGFGLLYGRDVGSDWGRAAEMAAVVCCHPMCCIDYWPCQRREAERAEFAVRFALSAEPRAWGQRGGEVVCSDLLVG